MEKVQESYYEMIQPFINSYYENNAKKLHSVVDRIFNKYYGGTVNKDIDEFYGVATDVIMEIRQNHTYDPSKSDFDAYLYRAILFGLKSEFKKRTCAKRATKIEEKDENGNLILDKNGKPKRIAIPDIRIDAPLKDNGELTFGDTLKSDFNTEESLTEITNGYSDKIELFLSKLSDIQKKIIDLIMKNYSTLEIKKSLNLSDKQYRDAWNIICSYDNKRILFNEKYDSEEYEMNETVVTEDVSERYKNTSYSIESISKQLKKKRIRDDHILQRHSGQWKAFAKSELISDILRVKSLTQIIISEEIKNGLKMQWLIDGKQRCTTLDDYLNDGFAISKNVKNYNIKYQATKIDENGYEILNGEGFTEMEWKIFDIRGKKFSQLPEELQDIFKDRQIPVLYNMNCTKKDIADDIARFNRSRPMNKAQNGWLGLDEDFAELVEKIAKMQFFQPEYDGSSYTSTSNTSGALRRIIVESIMVSDFMDEYCDFEKMCEFLTEEASDSNFTEFYSLVERLTVVSNQDVAKLFNVKDSFLWFVLFSKFAKLNLDDKKFIEFMIEFNNTLHAKKINDESFDTILEKTKSTKDRSIVEKKMKLLEKLMLEYLHISESDVEVLTEEDTDEITFIAMNVGIDKNNVKNDLGFYKESLDCLKENTIKIGSKLLDEENQLSLLALVAYSYDADIDLDDWMTEYAKNNNTYASNQKDNFVHMKEDLKRFISNKKKLEKKSA